MTPPFNEWLVEQGHVGPSGKWVLARRTSRAVARYGEGTTFFSPRRFSELTEEHRVACREDVLLEIASEHADYNYPALRAAFEAGRRS